MQWSYDIHASHSWCTIFHFPFHFVVVFWVNKSHAVSWALPISEWIESEEKMQHHHLVRPVQNRRAPSVPISASSIKQQGFVFWEKKSFPKCTNDILLENLIIWTKIEINKYICYKFNYKIMITTMTMMVMVLVIIMMMIINITVKLRPFHCYWIGVQW